MLAFGAELSWRTWVKLDELPEADQEMVKKKMEIGGALYLGGRGPESAGDTCSFGVEFGTCHDRCLRLEGHFETVQAQERKHETASGWLLIWVFSFYFLPILPILPILLSVASKRSARLWRAPREGKRAEPGAYMKQREDKVFQGHFPEWTYETWPDWTEHPAGCRVIECKGTNHMDIKLDGHFKHELWKALSKTIESF